MKKQILIAVLLCGACALYASGLSEDNGEILDNTFELHNSGDDSFTDSIDDIFDDAQDVVEPVITEDKSINTSIGVENLNLPLRFTGSLNASIGAAYIHNEKPLDNEHKEDFSGYLDFTNYLYFSSIADETLSIHGSFITEMPSSGSLFKLYELYFTYLLLNRAYITAGKKSTSWGNIRLFSDTDNYSNTKDDDKVEDEDAVYTNILTDSRDGVSGLITIPYARGSLNFFALYDDDLTSSDEISYRNMSLAGALDVTVLQTNINVFFRRFADAKKEEDKKNKLVGIEIKRTVFGTDIYGQNICCIKDNDKLFKSVNAFEKIINTCGLYRLWDNVPKLGLIAEFQDAYHVDKNEHNGRLALYAGISRLGKNRAHGVGVNWMHTLYGASVNYNELSIGHSLSGVLPHASWRNAVVWDYGNNVNKVSLGSYLKINMSY